MKANHTSRTKKELHQNVTGSFDVVYWGNGGRKIKRVDFSELQELLDKLTVAQKEKTIKEFYYWKV